MYLHYQLGLWMNKFETSTLTWASRPHNLGRGCIENPHEQHGPLWYLHSKYLIGLSEWSTRLLLPLSTRLKLLESQDIKMGQTRANDKTRERKKGRNNARSGELRRGFSVSSRRISPWASNLVNKGTFAFPSNSSAQLVDIKQYCRYQ